jgi:hypothetical protein
MCVFNAGWFLPSCFFILPPLPHLVKTQEKTNNLQFTLLVDGSAIHPNKPLEVFTLRNISGTCKRGISLANIKGAKLEDIRVTGYEGPLLSTYNGTGSGLKGTAALEPPKTGEPIGAPGEKYRIH